MKAWAFSTRYLMTLAALQTGPSYVPADVSLSAETHARLADPAEDEANGAMQALPGSNLRNRAVRERAMSERAVNDIANVLPEPETPSIPICGPAGTLFVFDTDMCHGASVVQPGRRRRTMRGHTHSHTMLRAMGVH